MCDFDGDSGSVREAFRVELTAFAEGVLRRELSGLRSAVLADVQSLVGRLSLTEPVADHEPESIDRNRSTGTVSSELVLEDIDRRKKLDDYRERQRNQSAQSESMTEMREASSEDSVDDDDRFLKNRMGHNVAKELRGADEWQRLSGVMAGAVPVATAPAARSCVLPECAWSRQLVGRLLDK